MMMSKSIIGLIIIMGLAISCGGGGGGGSATTTSTSETESTTTDKFYYVRYTEAALNSPTLESGEYTSETSISGLSGTFDSTRILQGGAKASQTENVPEMILILKRAGLSSSISSTFHMVIYGLRNTQVTVGHFSLDFTSLVNGGPAVASVGQTNTNSQSLLNDLPSGTVFSVDSEGLVAWGGWTGAIDSEGKTFLLKNGNLFALGTRVESHTSGEIDNQEFSAISVLQFDDNNNFTVASGSGTGQFSNGRFGGINITFTQTNQSVGIPSATRPYRLSSSDSSLLEIGSDDTFATITEQGFLSSQKFLVVINPDNTSRPAVSVMFQ